MGQFEVSFRGKAQIEQTQISQDGETLDETRVVFAAPSVDLVEIFQSELESLHLPGYIVNLDESRAMYPYRRSVMFRYLNLDQIRNDYKGHVIEFTAVFDCNEYQLEEEFQRERQRYSSRDPIETLCELFNDDACYANDSHFTRGVDMRVFDMRHMRGYELKYMTDESGIQSVDDQTYYDYLEDLYPDEYYNVDFTLTGVDLTELIKMRPL